MISFRKEVVTIWEAEGYFLVFRLGWYQKSPCCQGEKLLLKTRKRKRYKQ